MFLAEINQPKYSSQLYLFASDGFSYVEVITSKVLRSPPWIGWPLLNICVINDHGYVSLVVNTSRTFPHSWLITGFVTGLTWWVLLVEQKLLTLPQHLSSPPVFSGVRVTQSFVLYAMFCRLLFVLFVLFPSVIVLSVLLHFTDSDYPFGNFKLFFLNPACSTSWSKWI